MLQRDIEIYVKVCNNCLALKAVCYKLYKDLQLLSIQTHQWKDLSMDFFMGLLTSTNWKNNSYNSIPVIVDRLIKMVNYKPVKVMINASSLAKVIINMIVCHHRVLKSIDMD